MSGVFLRPARSTDAGKAGAILSAFVDETEWMPRIHTRAEDISHVGAMIDRGWVTIAEKDDRVVGFSARYDAKVHALYVDPAERGQGCGTMLLVAMQDVSDRLSLWTFQANERAQAFYIRHGFTEAERTDGADNDEKLPDIRLEWKRGSR